MVWEIVLALCIFKLIGLFADLLWDGVSIWRDKSESNDLSEFR